MPQYLPSKTNALPLPHVPVQASVQLSAPCIAEFLTRLVHAHHHNLPSSHSVLNPWHSSFRPHHPTEICFSGPPRTSMLPNPTVSSQSSPHWSYGQDLAQLLTASFFTWLPVPWALQYTGLYFQPSRLLLLILLADSFSFLLNAGLPQGLVPAFISLLSTVLPLNTSPRPLSLKAFYVKHCSVIT